MSLWRCACSYSSKVEAPDEKVFSLAISKRYAKLEADKNFTFREELKAVTNALLEASPVGSMQAMMGILGQPFVQCPRLTVRLNTEHIDKVSRKIKNKTDLRRMEPSESAIDYGPETQLGRRSVYHELVKHQRSNFGDCRVTFYHVTVYYRIVRKTPTAADNGRSSVQDLKQLLKLNDDGSPAANSPSKFKLPGTDLVFSVLTEPTMYQSVYKNSRPKVIEMIPYIPVDDRNESFCYSALLLHTPWPFEGEIGLLSRENIDRMDVDMDADIAASMDAGTDVLMDEDTDVIMDDNPYIGTEDESDEDEGSDSSDEGSDSSDKGSDSSDEDDVDDVQDVHVAAEVECASAVMEDRCASPTRMSAVHVFSQQIDNMPQYVKASINNRQYSQEMLRNTGTPLASNEDCSTCVQTELGEMLAERLEDDVTDICHDPMLNNVVPVAPARTGVIQKTIGNLSLGHSVYSANFIRHANAEQQHKVRYLLTSNNCNKYINSWNTISKCRNTFLSIVCM